MKAIGLYRYLPTDDPACFTEVEIPTPRPIGHNLLVRVHAVSVNPVDTKQRTPRPDVENEPKIEHGGPLRAETLRQAHAQVEAGPMIGKLVLDGINLEGRAQ